MSVTFTTLTKQQETKATKTITHSTQDSKDSETKKKPTSEGVLRRTLAPFKKFTKDCNRKELQESQCIEADQKITESIKLDRDARFSRMGTWRITKKISRNGAVHLQTEATDKLAYLLSKIVDPAKKVAFFEEQDNLRKIYFAKIRQRRKKEKINKSKLHPVDKAKIIQEGMRAGKNMIQEEMAAKLLTEKVTKDKKNTAAYGSIRVLCKNVQSIKKEQGEREEMALSHMRQT